MTAASPARPRPSSGGRYHARGGAPGDRQAPRWPQVAREQVAREHVAGYGAEPGGGAGDAGDTGSDERTTDLGVGLTGLTRAIDTLAGIDLALVHPDELPDLVRALKRSGDRVAALKSRAIAAMERRGAQQKDGHASAKDWLAAELNEDPREAAKQTRRARRAGSRQATFEAFSKGDISEKHVDVIERAVRQAGADPEVDTGTLELELTEAARTMPPNELARHARRREITERPDRARRREAEQFALRNLRYVDREGGGAQCIIDLTAGDYEVHRSAVEALMTKDPADLPPDQRRRYGQRMYDAAMEAARRVLSHDPDVRARTGAPVTGIVIVDLDTLTGASPGAAELAHAGPASAETARRLLCDADVARVIKAGRSEVLDVGRSQRTATAAQARALLAVWHGCARCGAAPAFCQMHHIQWWDRDQGRTDLDNLLPLCWACHNAVHHAGLEVTKHPDGSVTFTSRAGTHHHRAPP